MGAKENSIVLLGLMGNAAGMSDARPSPIPAAAWRARLARWREAVVGAWVAPQSATLLRMSSEEVALIMRKTPENRQSPRG